MGRRGGGLTSFGQYLRLKENGLVSLLYNKNISVKMFCTNLYHILVFKENND